MKNKFDVIIIGSGLIGSAAARLIRKETDFSVLLIDGNDKYSASKCSAGIWKDSWINESIRDFVKDVSLPITLSTLGKKKFREVELTNQKGIREQFNFLPPEEILVNPDLVGVVDKIDSVNKLVYIGKEAYKAKHSIVVAAGYRTPEILTKNNIPFKTQHFTQWGGIFKIKGQTKEQKIENWAPYRQAVVFNYDKNTYYFGDGCTVKNPIGSTNKEIIEQDSRVIKSRNRLIQHSQEIGGIKETANTKYLQGLRPYITKDSEFVEVLQNGNVIAAAGTAKNGTILCFGIAFLILEGIINP